MRMLKNDRRVHQRLFVKQLKRVSNEDKIPAAAAVEPLNEFGLLTSDPDEHVRLWSNQYECVGKAHPRVREELVKYQIPNTKCTCDTGQTRNKLLEQWVHLANHAAGHSRPGTTHQTAYSDLSRTAIPRAEQRVRILAAALQPSR